MLPASAAETESECAPPVVSCVVQAKLCLRKFILLFSFSQYTPLHFSAHNGHLEVTRLLVESKADVAARDRCFSPPPLSPFLTHYLHCSWGNTALKSLDINGDVSTAHVAAYLHSIGALQ